MNNISNMELEKENFNKNTIKRFNPISLLLSVGFLLFAIIYSIILRLIPNLFEYILSFFTVGVNDLEEIKLIYRNIFYLIIQTLTFLTTLFIFFIYRNDSISKNPRKKSILNLILKGVGFGILTIIITVVSINIMSYLSGELVKSKNTELVNKMFKNYPYMLIATVIIAPILEEITFKAGIFTFFHELFQDKSKFLNTIIPAVISAFIFGFIHDGLKLVPVYFLPSFLGCLIYKKNNSLIPVIVGHFVNNLIVSLLLLSV